MIGTEEENAKNPTRGKLQKIRSCRFFIGEWSYIIWDMEETPNPNLCRAENTYRKEKKNFYFEWTQTPRYGEHS